MGTKEEGQATSRAKSFNLFIDSGRTSKWEGEAPTIWLPGVFIHQSGGNLGGGDRWRGVSIWR